MTVVSIIMPAHNAEKTIRRSVESVMAQTYPDWELLVIDDASQDSTVQVVKSLAEKDKRIRLYVNTQNMGVSQARNRGITHTRGKWLAFLDSDDCWHKAKLERQLKFNEETEAVISYTGTSYINEAGVISGYILKAERELSYKTLLKKNIMSCSSVMVRREIMSRIFFAEGDLSEDYVAWMQILRKVRVAYGLDEPLLIYRLSNRSKSGSRLHSAKMTFNAYRQTGYCCFLSFLLTVRYSLHSVSKRAFIRLGRL